MIQKDAIKSSIVLLAVLVLAALPRPLDAQTVITCGQNISTSDWVTEPGSGRADASVNMSFTTGLTGYYDVTTCYVPSATCLVPWGFSYPTSPLDTELGITLTRDGVNEGSARYDNSSELTSSGRLANAAEIVSGCLVGGSQQVNVRSGGERAFVRLSAGSTVTVSARQAANARGFICITVTAQPCGPSPSTTYPPAASTAAASTTQTPGASTTHTPGASTTQAPAAGTTPLAATTTARPTSAPTPLEVRCPAGFNFWNVPFTAATGIVYGQCDFTGVVVQLPDRYVIGGYNISTQHYEHTGSIIPVPTSQPQLCCARAYSAACMSGNTEVVRQGIGRSKVADLAVGHVVDGIGEDMSLTSCQVVAVEQWGRGLMSSNYTADHLVVRDGSNGTAVESFGTQGTESMEDKYVVLTDCPAAYDVSGVRFTPMSTHVCGDTPMTWGNYVSLYRTYINLVRTTGTFWARDDTYINKSALVQVTPDLCREFFTCAVDGGDCEEFERIARQIVDEQIGDSERNTTLEAFPDLGNASAPGSVSEFSKQAVQATSNSNSESDNDTIQTTTIIIIVVVLAAVIVMVVGFAMMRRSSRSTDSAHKEPVAHNDNDNVVVMNATTAF